MDKYLSNKLKILSFVLILLVVMIHANIISNSSSQISIFIQRFISDGLALCAVPMFFIISGFLFGYSFDSTKLFQSYKSKLKKRVRSLLIPYLLCEIVGILFLFIFQLIVPAFIINSGLTVHNFVMSDIIKEMFISPKIFYQLWFVRDLFLCVVISPLLILGIKYLKIVFILALLVLQFYIAHIYILGIGSIFYFSLGLYFSFYHSYLLRYRFSSKFWWLVPILWFVATAVICATHTKSSFGLLIQILGIISIWIGYDLIFNIKKKYFIPLDLTAFTFFIFLFHEPLLSIIKKSYIAIVGTDSIFKELFLYFVAPIIIIAICIYAGVALKSKRPRMYSFITGGR